MQSGSSQDFNAESLYGYFYGNQSEDCLTLNVWTKSSCLQSGINCSLPVLVWIYGGSFVVGGTYFKTYNGALLASEGSVVVTLNYRVGIFGFLVSQELLAQDKKNVNFGLQDQQFALRWVSENIAAFGGDPNRITVFGESAGSMSISLHLTMPSSFSLFQRAFMISGTLLQKYPSRFNAVSDMVKGSYCILTHLGCSNITCARQTLTASQLIEGAENASTFADFAFWPVIDGVVLPQNPLAAMLAGQFMRPIDVATLTMLDDGALFVDMKANDAHLGYFISYFFPPPHDEPVRKAYSSSNYPSPGHAEAALLRDLIFACPTRTLMKLVSSASPDSRVYQGVFVHTDSWFAGDATGYAQSLGVMHSSANPFIFGSPFYPFTPAEAGLSAFLRRNLARFAADGTMPDFPRWDPSARNYLRVDAAPAVASDYLRSACDLMGNEVQAEQIGRAECGDSRMGGKGGRGSD
jgi:para-nitrobenzyl esterase